VYVQHVGALLLINFRPFVCPQTAVAEITQNVFKGDNSVIPYTKYERKNLTTVATKI